MIVAVNVTVSPGFSFFAFSGVAVVMFFTSALFSETILSVTVMSYIGRLPAFVTSYVTCMSSPGSTVVPGDVSASSPLIFLETMSLSSGSVNAYPGSSGEFTGGAFGSGLFGSVGLGGLP
ncbi:hypothetical protein CXF48_05810 [Corynebacterium bovis]|uniref:Uncharacterized protein n=1 Tax=Corynebacterium bovis TaxID=36808 RepID=A0A426PYZ0_9CORY|nr:hypothetical protein CXF48_05810 [Corynebacterium bovis]